MDFRPIPPPNSGGVGPIQPPPGGLTIAPISKTENVLQSMLSGTSGSFGDAIAQGSLPDGAPLWKQGAHQLQSFITEFLAKNSTLASTFNPTVKTILENFLTHGGEITFPTDSGPTTTQFEGQNLESFPGWITNHLIQNVVILKSILQTQGCVSSSMSQGQIGRIFSAHLYKNSVEMAAQMPPNESSYADYGKPLISNIYAALSMLPSNCSAVTDWKEEGPWPGGGGFVVYGGGQYAELINKCVSVANSGHLDNLIQSIV